MTGFSRHSPSEWRNSCIQSPTIYRPDKATSSDSVELRVPNFCFDDLQMAAVDPTIVTSAEWPAPSSWVLNDASMYISTR